MNIELPIKIIHKPTFSIFYSTIHKIPLLTVENFDEPLKKTTIKRSSFTFIKDPIIKSQHSSSYIDYKSLQQFGYTFGHSATSRFHNTSITNKEHTFKLTNIIPQHIILNNGILNIFEEFAENIITSNKFDQYKIYTGSLFLSKQQHNKISTISYIVTNNNKVSVPTHIYKIIHAIKSNKHYIVCYLFKNKFQPSFTSLKQYTVNYKKLEKLSGFEFFKGIKIYKLCNKINCNFVLKSHHNKLLENSINHAKLINARSIDDLNKYYKKLNKNYFYKKIYKIKKKQILSKSYESQSFFTK